MRPTNRSARSRFLALAVLALLLVAAGAQALSPAEETARRTVAREIAQAKAGRSPFVGALGRGSDFLADFRKVAARHPEVGMPRTVLVDGRPAKILVPLNMGPERVGGFFQVSADGRTLLSWLAWDADLQPVFQVARAEWEKADTANEVPGVAELLPVKSTYSAGWPVEPGDVEDCFLIAHLDGLPSKTQEERKVYTGSNLLKDWLGRRTGSSKCLSYAASLASDWWRLALGLRLGKYTSFVNGTLEYGLNPRLVEAYYAATEESPYTWKKYTGKDRVTGEAIAYSPKHYAYTMSGVPHPAEVKDPLRPGLTHRLPPGGFAMDQPFHVVFNRSQGKVPAIREALQRYGILYGQHTMRLLSDRISLKAVGVHSVNLVGTGRYRGKDVVLYYETFGRNHRDYLEDSFYGPRLRAFPVEFFYQGIAFPHRLDVTVVRQGADLALRFTDFLKRPLAPETLEVKIDGTPSPVRAAAIVRLPGAARARRLELRYGRRYFCLPEENGLYERVFLLGDHSLVELREYEKVVAARGKARQGLIEALLHRPDSFYDHMVRREEALRQALVPAIREAVREPRLRADLAAAFTASPVLRESALGQAVTSLLQFRQAEGGRPR